MDNEEIKRAIQAGWDAMSRTYQVDSHISLDDIHYAPFAPGERYYRLLGRVSGKRVLELACGGAQNSVTLSRWGANVVAMDFSANQLRHAFAARREAGARFELISGDMESPTMFRRESFDIVMSSFGWEFIPDLNRCVAACAELLRPGGQLLMCTVHPLTAFDWRAQSRVLNVADYFNPPLEVWDEPVPEGRDAGLTYFRTIEELAASVTGAGLLMDRILEPCPVDGQESPYEGRYWADHWERLKHVPFAVVISARKLD